MDSKDVADTISENPCRRRIQMPFTDQKMSFEHLLSQQLQAFSQLTECLTLRVLELEERLAKIESLLPDEQDLAEGSTHKLLAESELLVRRLKDLLDEGPSNTNSLREVQVNSENTQCDPLVEKEELEDAPPLHLYSDEIGAEQPSEVDEDYLGDGLEAQMETEYVDDPQTSLLSA